LYTFFYFIQYITHTHTHTKHSHLQSCQKSTIAINPFHTTNFMCILGYRIKTLDGNAHKFCWKLDESFIK